jgi:predicted esterase
MRLLRNLIVATCAVAVAACGISFGSHNSTPPVPTAPPPHSPPPIAQRGKIDALSRVTLITKAQMSAGLEGSIISSLGGPPACNVVLYSIMYETIGVNGEAANASAAFFVPGTGCKGPFPLVGYGHGTNAVKEQLITQPNTSNKNFTAPDQNPIVVAAIFAAHGYATAATDYLGLGLSTYPYHPYLHADSEASAIVDSMRAARSAAKQLHVRLSGKVFVTGHSQGGQSSLATQRAIESQFAREFDLRGAAPSSGPYDLSQTFEDSLRHQSEDAPLLAAYILPGYHKTYGNIYTDPVEIFKTPYSNYVETLMPFRTYGEEAAALAGKTLPLSLHDLLRPTFFNSFLNDPTSDARKDAHDNDLLVGWTPRAPVWLCGGDRDPEVEFKNAIAAETYFKKRGATVSLLDVNPFIPSNVPLADYHVVVALFCLPTARKVFFDPLR